MGHKEHKHHAAGPIHCAVLTISDTRTEETDDGGRLIKACLGDAGNTIAHYQILTDDPEKIRTIMTELSGDASIQAVLLTGGTGIGKRDNTYEVIQSLLEKKLDGFGELFRYLSYLEIGSAAMMSRAIAGAFKGKIIISMPGSPAAVRLAMEKLIIPELGHMVWTISH
jgi:molybdenum cofactor biosynthesis protein B